MLTTADRLAPRHRLRLKPQEADLSARSEGVELSVFEATFGLDVASSELDGADLLLRCRFTAQPTRSNGTDLTL